MIPKLLHQIWVGPEPVPNSLMRAWQEMHPEWEHHLWTEQELSQLGLRNQSAFRAYMTGKRYHGAANVARYEVLYAFGGVYVDMDTVPLRPFDGGPFMRSSVDFFAGYVQPRESRPGLIGNAYIGAIPGHPILARCSDDIGRQSRLVPAFRHSGVYPFTEAVEAHLVGTGDKRVRIMPTAVFFPHDKEGEPAPGYRGFTYAEHLWGSTRVSSWRYPRD